MLRALGNMLLVLSAFMSLGVACMMFDPDPRLMPARSPYAPQIGLVEVGISDSIQVAQDREFLEKSRAARRLREALRDSFNTGGSRELSLEITRFEVDPERPSRHVLEVTMELSMPDEAEPRRAEFVRYPSNPERPQDSLQAVVNEIVDFVRYAPDEAPELSEPSLPSAQ